MAESRIPIGSAWHLPDNYCRAIIDKQGKHLLYQWFMLNANGEIEKSGWGGCRIDTFYGWISGRSRCRGEGRSTGEAVRAPWLEEVFQRALSVVGAFDGGKEAQIENMWASLHLGKELSQSTNG